MVERCPSADALRAYGSAELPDRESAELETHLLRCRTCAETLEDLTLAQLHGLLGAHPSIPQPGTLSHPALLPLVQEAMAFAGSSRQPDPDQLRALLDPPVTIGHLGTFAGYDVVEIAGQGGMGVVLRAQDRTLNREVAIKVVLPQAWDGSVTPMQLLDEARAVAALQDDHIVMVYRAGMEKGLPYLVMPFHPEGTLEQRLRQSNRLPTPEVVRLGIQVAKGLSATHRHGILHRDIKPSNVLLEDQGRRIRLADFGLARPERSAGATVAGTPHYMSPEQARGETIDARSDLFSLGALLFQAAAGQTVFAGATAREVLATAAQGEHPTVRLSAPWIPTQLAQVLERLLAPKPEDRFASADEVLAALERIDDKRGHAQRLKRAAAIAATLCLVAAATVLVLDWTGKTALVNTLLCHTTGDGFYIRGRFGTYPRLTDAVAFALPQDTIELRFSGERQTESFRVGNKPLTIRAARNCTPVLVATNNADPLILVDAPLTLEGLTLWRRGPNANFAPLASIEEAPLHLVHCRILRSAHQAQNILEGGRLRPHSVPVDRLRALLAFQHGSRGYLRNCLVSGTATAALQIRSSADKPTTVEITDSLITADCGLQLGPEAEAGATLLLQRSVVVSPLLLEVSRPQKLTGVVVRIAHSVLDRSEGRFIRAAHPDGLARLQSVRWTEEATVYAGQGGYASLGRRLMITESRWNELMNLSGQGHQSIDNQVFPTTCFRSGLTLDPSDLDPAVPQQVPGVPGLDLSPIGPGPNYDRFQGTPAHQEWTCQVREAAQTWQQRNRPSN